MSVHSVCIGAKCQKVSTCLWLCMSHLISGRSVIMTVKSIELRWVGNGGTTILLKILVGNFLLKDQKRAGKVIRDY